MIVLDTNIISESIKVPSSPKVLEWLDQQQTDQLYITTISIAEIFYGLRILKIGKKRQGLAEKFEHLLANAFEQRILDFDLLSARFYAEIVGSRREQGRPIDIADGQIAAIARSKSFALATRNVRDFELCGIKIINPFDL